MINIDEDEIRADIFSSIRTLSPKADVVTGIIVDAIFHHSTTCDKKNLIILDKSSGSAKSKKIDNLFLDWRILLNEISESVLILCGAATIPIILPLAGLVVINKFYKLASINLSKHHALTLWVLWANRNQNNVISLDGLLKSVNLAVVNQRLKSINENELNDIVDDLSKNLCIKKINDNEVLMLEKVSLNN